MTTIQSFESAQCEANTKQFCLCSSQDKLLQLSVGNVANIGRTALSELKRHGLDRSDPPYQTVVVVLTTELVMRQ